MNLPILEQVKRKQEPLTSRVELDGFTKIAQDCFDFEFDGLNKFYPFEKPSKIPSDFGIGLIIGASGNGKSTLLKEFGQEEVPTWEHDKAIISHFKDKEEAINKLNAVGLNSVPSWTKPYHALSTGEKFRANLAKQIKSGAVIDEFTSVVDRNVAKSCSVAIRRYIINNDLKNVVFCTCHNDIVEWLCPEWIFDADTGTLYDGRSLRQPTIELSLYETHYSSWELFKKHHYLNESINKASRNFIAKWGEEIVGFISVLPAPNGYVKNAWRFHRLVVLPDYQGMGLGTAIMNDMGETWLSRGWRLFIKTAHVKLGDYMERSNKWVATTHNGKKRTEAEKAREKEKWHNYFLDTKRVCYTYEYVGVDYLTKPHYRIGIKFENNVAYDTVKETLDSIIDKHKEEYIVFVSTEVGKENLADQYAREKAIRREHFGAKAKFNELIIF